MNQHCIITTRRNSEDYGTEVDVYYIEDYLEFGSIDEARILTEEIFKTNKEFVQFYDYDGYKVSWSWYDHIYIMCLKYTEIKALLFTLRSLNYETINIKQIDLKYEKILKYYFVDKQIKLVNPNRIKVNIKNLLLNLLSCIFSIVSIIYFSIQRKTFIGIRTEDMILKGTKSDFRLNSLYTELDNKKIGYIEFIRNRGLKNFIHNIFIRKRFAIYYDSISYFIRLFAKNENFSKKAINFNEAVLFDTAHENNVLINSIKVIKKIYKLCRINSMIIISFGSRSAPLAIAAKSLKIKTIGIMHGQSMRSYVTHEFMETYNEKKKIGPDIYGVWSKYKVQYFQKYCKIVEQKNICNSGLLRPIENFGEKKFKRICDKKIKILIISEPLVSAKEILPYIKNIIDDDRFEISIKVRPMIQDSFYEELKEIYPKIISIPKFDGKIMEDGKGFDIFLGTHSTAVLEACLIGKLSLLVNTHKWGDYFEIDTLLENRKLLVDNPDDITSEILLRIKSEQSLKTVNLIQDKFFGNNKDGVKWLINQIQKK